MPCEDHQSDPNTGLELETWTKATPSAIKHCELTDLTKLAHHVEVRNFKSYNRQVFIKAEILGNPSRASFEGSSNLVRNDSQWEGELNLLGRGVGRSGYLDMALIKKKLQGHERIAVTVEYADQWNPKLVKSATDLLGPLVIQINVV